VRKKNYTFSLKVSSCLYPNHQILQNKLLKLELCNFKNPKFVPSPSWCKVFEILLFWKWQQTFSNLGKCLKPISLCNAKKECCYPEFNCSTNEKTCNKCDFFPIYSWPGYCSIGLLDWSIRITIQFSGLDCQSSLFISILIQKIRELQSLSCSDNEDKLRFIKNL